MRVISIVVVGALGSSVTSAATFSFRVGEAGYTGGRETYIQQANPDAALGAEAAISVDASDGGGVSQALLAFDGIVGSAAVPAGSVVTSATIELTVDSVGSGMMMHRMVSDWSESTSTWNSLVNGIQTDNVEASSMISLSIGANDGNSNVADSFILLDVTADVQAWVNGQANHGWAMLPFVPNGTNGLDFYSKEEVSVSSRPKLTVNYVIPEPASLTLVAGVAAVLLRRRG
jgi:hypothetical protein